MSEGMVGFLVFFTLFNFIGFILGVAMTVEGYLKQAINIYTIPVYLGIFLGALSVYTFRFIFGGFKVLGAENLHEFLCQNPFDLIKFRIKFERKE